MSIYKIKSDGNPSFSSIRIRPSVGGPNQILLNKLSSGGGGGGASPGLNEPSGYNLIFDSTWQSGLPPFLGSGTDSQGWFNRAGNISAITEATPDGDNAALRGLFPAGAPGGSGTYRMDNEFGGVMYKNIYYAVRMKHSANFTDNGNTGTKYGFFMGNLADGGGTNHYFGFNGGTTDDFRPMVGFQFQPNGPSSSFNKEATDPGTGLLFKSIPLDTYRLYEVVILGNTGGLQNGSVQMWVDGLRVINSLNNIFVWHQNFVPGFAGVTWNSTYGGGLNPVPFDMHMDCDRWYCSGVPV